MSSTIDPTSAGTYRWTVTLNGHTRSGTEPTETAAMRAVARTQQDLAPLPPLRKRDKRRTED